MANRVLIGKDLLGKMKLRVSLPGFNVMDTNLNPTQLALDSDWAETLGLHVSGLVAITIPANNNVDVTHPAPLQDYFTFPSLGYIPHILILQLGSTLPSTATWYTERLRFVVTETKVQGAYTESIPVSVTAYLSYFVIRAEL